MKTMSRGSVVALVASVVLSTVTIAAPKQAPARLGQARYVALGYDMGDRFLADTDAVANPEVLPEDRRALNVIYDRIQEWGRYTLTVRPEQAELLIAVRTGRRAVAGGGAPVGSGSGPAGRAAPTFGYEVSSTADMLSIFEAAGGRPGTLLWREALAGGLASSRPRLFESLKSAVDALPKK